MVDLPILNYEPTMPPNNVDWSSADAWRTVTLLDLTKALVDTIRDFSLGNGSPELLRIQNAIIEEIQRRHPSEGRSRWSPERKRKR